MRRSVLALLLPILLAVEGHALKTEKLQTQVLGPKGARLSSSIDVVSQRVLVRFAPGTSPAQIAAVLSGQGAAALGTLEPIGWTVVQLATGASVAGNMMARNPALGTEYKLLLKDSPNFIGVAKGDDKLRQKVNEIIAQAKASGEIDRLCTKWLGRPAGDLPN